MKMTALRPNEGGIGMDYRERIAVDPHIMLGKPVIRGTRITVEIILRKLSEGISVEGLLEAYPNLVKEDVLATLSYSADVVGREEIFAA
jgi:uncharacterized protein (DUF433 family)